MNKFVRKHVPTALIALATGASAGLIGAGLAPRPQTEYDLSTNTATTIFEQGDWRQTLATMQRFYNVYRDADFDPRGLPAGATMMYWRSADEALLSEQNRSKGKLPITNVGGDSVWGRQIAIHSDLYVSFETKAAKDGQPSGIVRGFHLVIYRDGSWEKVPVDKVRSLPGKGTLLFPKMQEYNDPGVKPAYGGNRTQVIGL